MIGREAVQLGDLLEWAETHGHAQHEDVIVAKEIKEQANKVVQVCLSVCLHRLYHSNYCPLSCQLVDGLYSTHVESEQFETVTAQVRSLMDSFMDDLYREHVQVRPARDVTSL